MRPRAFADLSQQSDPNFFRKISEGLSHIAHNVSSIDADFRRLVEDNRGRGARILHACAAEEAGKFLILLDAVRCPRIPPVRFTAQLKKANSHLAKGLYAEANDIRHFDFSEVKLWIERESAEFYLDGPNDVDWIFRNRIAHSRENTLYVDYVAAEGAHYWDIPGMLDENISLLTPSRAAVEMVLALEGAGFTNAPALKVIADTWRPVPMRNDMDVRELRRLNVLTLNELSRLNLLVKQQDNEYSMIATNWFFPLYDLPIKSVKMAPADLESERNKWSPE
tara:strand:- start:104 stop:943 length:840 start_codon:yes stop_codon:yes gene_type:complete